MAGAVSSRLERMRAAVAISGRPPAPPPPLPREPARDDALAKILRGDWHETPEGPVFVRDDWFPLHHEHGSLPLAAALAVQPEALDRLATTTTPVTGGFEASRFGYFDIETTGLAGGTGTYVILAGLGSYEDGAFRVRQYFLADVAHEAAMLRMLADDLARFDALVTYNGRAFDIPFVEARLALSRIASPCTGMAHLDLLQAVRRLYRHRMPGCRLAEAERRLLRIDRPDDVPGWLIPSLYFDYARAGRAAPLRGVFRHNADDVLSLVGVLAAIARLIAGGSELDPEDAVAVARFWEAAGEPSRAMPLYRQALPWLEGGDDWGWSAARHAALCKRDGERGEAVPLWEALWIAGDRPAGLELAKHREHHARDFEAAEAVTLALVDGCAPHEVEALERRLARIRRKAARA